MSETLRELSDRAYAGLWHLESDSTDEQWISGEDGRFGDDDIIADMPREDTESRQRWSANAAFIIALVNAYRSGHLHDDAALAEARSEAAEDGIRRALEYVKTHARKPVHGDDMWEMGVSAGEESAIIDIEACLRDTPAGAREVLP